MAGRREEIGDELAEIVEEAQGGAGPRGERRRRRGRAVVKIWLRRAFVENAALKFVAFVLALTVFILVQSQDDVQVPFNVGIEYRMPSDRVLVSETVDQVRITVKGSRRAIRRFDEGRVERIPIDLRGHRRSEFVFSADMVQLPKGLELVRFTPPSILTRFERRVRKEVPVEVRKIGDVPPGFLVTSVITEPARVVVSGAETAVEATVSVKTREVPLTGRTESVRETVDLVPPETFVEVLTPENAMVNVELTIIEEQAPRRVGPLDVAVRPGPAVTDESAARFEARPSQVTVILRGSRLAVEAVDEADLTAYVEISADDVAVGRTRAARVVVPTPAKGIAIEIVPEEVTVGLK
jgi:YbbR domain-containing protein